MVVNGPPASERSILYPVIPKQPEDFGGLHVRIISDIGITLAVRLSGMEGDLSTPCNSSQMASPISECLIVFSMLSQLLTRFGPNASCRLDDGVTQFWT